MGGAQPLAATMAGFNMLAVECRESRIAMRLKTGYLDAQAGNLDEALAMLDGAKRDGKPLSVGLLGNIVDVLERLLERGIEPDALTDQTSAHDPVNGYLPQGWSVEQWDERRESDPRGTSGAALKSMARHVECLLQFKARGLPVFDYGNNLRQMAKNEGVESAPSTFRASCPSTFARSSAAASDRSAGRRCRVIRRISTRPMRRSGS